MNGWPEWEGAAGSDPAKLQLATAVYSVLGGAARRAAIRDVEMLSLEGGGRALPHVFGASLP